MNPVIFSIFVYIIVFSFLIGTVRNILYFIFLWQLKEYRLDRLLAHLHTPQGRKLVINLFSAVKWILFLGILAGIYFHQNLSSASYFLFWFVWIVELTKIIREWILYGWRLPVFTVKIVCTLTVVFFLAAFILFDVNLSAISAKILFFGPFVDRFLWVLVSIPVGLFNIPAFLYKKVLIFLAKRKMLSFDKLTVIGITGSYGKTSTKEFLATILSEKFKVAKTPGFNNTAIGVAKYILTDLKQGYQMFVVEMGAYKKGEIKEICDIVRPIIGIITGINEQHLELFGSVENIKRAKFELIESLPKKGIAILNGDNSHLLDLDMTQTADKKLIADIYKRKGEVSDVRIFKDHLEFKLLNEGKTYNLEAALLGDHFISNLLGAIHAAKHCGMKAGEIKKGISKIVSPPHTMELLKNSKFLLVDDTFNANPDGVMAAAEYMSHFKGKKILVLTPLIELGEGAVKIHEVLGEKIVQHCDLILLTNINYNKSFVTGARKAGGEGKVQIVNTTVGLKLIRENLDPAGVAVFEGKEAGRILYQLINSN